MTTIEIFRQAQRLFCATNLPRLIHQGVFATGFSSEGAHMEWELGVVDGVQHKALLEGNKFYLCSYIQETGEDFRTKLPNYRITTRLVKGMPQ